MTQTIDFRFEALFLLLVAASLVSLVTVIVMAIAKRGRTAMKVLKTLGIVWGVYLAVVLIVAAATPQRVIPVGHDLCWDEMCFAVTNVKTAAQLDSSTAPVRADGTFYVVTVRVSSRARGRAQSERGLRAQLWSQQHTYPISEKGQAAWDAGHPESSALTTRVAPGQAIFSDQVFDVPAQSSDFGVLLTNGFTPGYFVIGECPLFHKPTILRISPE
ncbi:MAG TPA: hypothetical protein VMT38_02850 [Terracidiphilus sp.]|nr:hypothetical protein [Terracidiphilus sp.]